MLLSQAHFEIQNWSNHNNDWKPASVQTALREFKTKMSKADKNTERDGDEGEI